MKKSNPTYYGIRFWNGKVSYDYAFKKSLLETISVGSMHSWLANAILITEYKFGANITIASMRNNRHGLTKILFLSDENYDISIDEFYYQLYQKFDYARNMYYIDIYVTVTYPEKNDIYDRIKNHLVRNKKRYTIGRQVQ